MYSCFKNLKKRLEWKCAFHSSSAGKGRLRAGSRLGSWRCGLGKIIRWREGRVEEGAPGFASCLCVVGFSCLLNSAFGFCRPDSLWLWLTCLFEGKKELFHQELLLRAVTLTGHVWGDPLNTVIVYPLLKVPYNNAQKAQTRHKGYLLPQPSVWQTNSSFESRFRRKM